MKIRKFTTKNTKIAKFTKHSPKFLVRCQLLYFVLSKINRRLRKIRLRGIFHGEFQNTRQIKIRSTSHLMKIRKFTDNYPPHLRKIKEDWGAAISSLGANTPTWLLACRINMIQKPFKENMQSTVTFTPQQFIQ